MPSEQATHSLQQSVRHTNFIAHHDTLASREVSSLSESVAVDFLAVNIPAPRSRYFGEVCLIYLELRHPPVRVRDRVLSQCARLGSEYQNWRLAVVQWDDL